MKNRYDCSKCPSYCCSYGNIELEPDDIARLAAHFKTTEKQVIRRFTSKSTAVVERDADDAHEAGHVNGTNSARVTNGMNVTNGVNATNGANGANGANGKEPPRVLRHREDKYFGTICGFLDQETRQCTVYEARPKICGEFPGTRRCGYYDFLCFERKVQDDPDYVAVTGN